MTILQAVQGLTTELRMSISSTFAAAVPLFVCHVVFVSPPPDFSWITCTGGLSSGPGALDTAPQLVCGKGMPMRCLACARAAAAMLAVHSSEIVWHGASDEGAIIVAGQRMPTRGDSEAVTIATLGYITG